MSHPRWQIARMKSYTTRYRRPHLLPVPYRAHPDRLARGAQFLRSLRLSLAAPTAPGLSPQQAEFDFLPAPALR